VKKMDGRRSRYVPLSVDFATGNTGTRILGRFGHAGLLTWVAFLAACKRSTPEGTFRYGAEADGWRQLGLDHPEPPGFTLDAFFTYTGQLKQTRRRRTGRLCDVKVTRWGEWNKPWRRQREDEQDVTETPANEQEIQPESNRDTTEMQTESNRDTRSEVDLEVEVEKPLAAPPRERARDDLWDTLAELLGEPATDSERGRRNKALKELRAVDATPAELRKRAAAYRSKWPGIDMTASALAANWSLLNGRHGTVDPAEKARRLRERIENHERGST
jgi:hypothetical protein